MSRREVGSAQNDKYVLICERLLLKWPSKVQFKFFLDSYFGRYETWVKYQLNCSEYLLKRELAILLTEDSGAPNLIEQFPQLTS